MPEEVPNGYGPEADLGTNLALRAPAVTDVSCAADGPVDKINDGVIPSSKWCGLSTNGSAYLDLGKKWTSAAGLYTMQTAEVQERVSAIILLILNSFMQGMTERKF